MRVLEEATASCSQLWVIRGRRWQKLYDRLHGAANEAN